MVENKSQCERRRGAGREESAKRHWHSFSGKWQRSGGASRVEFCVYPTTRVYWPTVEPRHVSEEANQAAAAAAASWWGAARLAALPLAAYWRSATRNCNLLVGAGRLQLQHCNHFTSTAAIATPTAGHHVAGRAIPNQMTLYNLCSIIFAIVNQCQTLLFLSFFFFLSALQCQSVRRFRFAVFEGSTPDYVCLVNRR